jgi:hypothetical protein
VSLKNEKRQTCDKQKKPPKKRVINRLKQTNALSKKKKEKDKRVIKK